MQIKKLMEDKIKNDGDLFTQQLSPIKKQPLTYKKLLEMVLIGIDQILVKL